MDWIHFLFGFHGRINRAKYWLFLLIGLIVGILLSALTYAFQTIGLGALGIIIAVIVDIAMFIAFIAVAIKRLHDRDRSAWWLLVFYLVPGVLLGGGTGLAMATAMASTRDATSMILSLVAFVVAFVLSVWGFVELACLRGTVGQNRYGPDPLWPAAERAAP
jgi:uncharacterized membrane protein YhaH (DUF805 family)